MRTFAFIFARGGSKGLPGKNVRLLGGVPLLACGIRLAQSIDKIDRVFVSTDDSYIASVAREYGAEVIVRPAELATDTASEWMAWRHAIVHVREELDLDFDVFLSLPATSPLRNQDDVRACLAMLRDDTDVVVTVTPSSRNPYFNMVREDVNGYSHILLSDANFTRRQDAPVVFDMTTVAYVTRPDFVLDYAGLFEGRVKSVVVPKERAVDIDDEFDFRVAEALLKS
jgi:N-acylneuraminate cytidylyltransferase